MSDVAVTSGTEGNSYEGPQVTSAPITASVIRERYDTGSKAVRAEQYQYAINHSFMRGEQWVYHHRATNTIKELPRDPERVRVTSNRLWPTSRTILAKLGRRELTFEVPPSAGDDAHRTGARLAAGVLDDLKTREDWESIRDQVSRVTWEAGTGLLCQDWDPTAGDPVMDPMTGRILRTGDIKTTVLTVAEACTEPGARDIERAAWWIKSCALPPEEVKRQWPDKFKGKPAADSSATLTAAQHKLLDDQQSGGSPIPLTLVLTYYERPNPDRPKGCVAVVVGDRIVEGPFDWPFPFTDRLNVVCMRETKVHGRWTGDTVLSAAVPVQAAYNAAISSIVEHMKLAGNARLLVPMGGMDHLDELSDLPSEILEYVPMNGLAPNFLSPPQMPGWWIEQPRMLATEIDDILGVHDVSRGAAPPNIESGVGLSILAEQDDTPVGGMAKEIAAAFSRYASLALKTYEAKVSIARTASVRKPGMAPREVEWRGDDFKGQTTAVCPLDAVMPQSKEAMLQRAMQFQDRGLIPPERPDIFAKVAGLSRHDDFTGAINPAVDKAQRENYEMSLGNVMLPAEFDPHTVHIAEHNTFRMTEEYERMDDAQRSIYDDHVAAHEMLAAEEAAKVAMQAGASPLLGMAADQNEPDPAIVAAATGTQPPPPGEDPNQQQPEQQPPDAAPTQEMPA